jgi:acetoin utilization protein AcuC
MQGDPITHLGYSSAVHSFTATRLSQLADRLCAGRLVAMGGGGYNRDNLAKAWCAVVKAMIVA